MARSWHKFVSGVTYDRDEVIAACEMHIQNGRVKNRADAEAWLEPIRCFPYERLVWTPFGSSWGRSPMNPNAWRTEAREPIWEQRVIPKLPAAK